MLHEEIHLLSEEEKSTWATQFLSSSAMKLLQHLHLSVTQ